MSVEQSGRQGKVNCTAGVSFLQKAGLTSVEILGMGVPDTVTKYIPDKGISGHNDEDIG